MKTAAHHFIAVLSVAILSTSFCRSQFYSLDKSTAGTLGATLEIGVFGAPANQLLILIPSLNAGPTPLALVDPGDARSLNVGLDLSGNWFFLFTSPLGLASFTMPLPLVPALNNTVLHMQSVGFGTTSLVGPISNNVVAQIGLPGPALPVAATLVTPRAFSEMVPNVIFSEVMVAGGGAGTLTNSTGLTSTEVWDYLTLSTRPGPNMNNGRSLFKAVQLFDLRVLLIGGADNFSAGTDTCELYDPITDTFTPTGSMSTPRILHAAARMADGRVMVAGGTTSLTGLNPTVAGTLSSVEIYDPTTGTWSPGPSLGGARLAPALTSLPNTDMMVTGGIEIGFFGPQPASAVSTTAVEFYSLAANSWSPGPSMNGGRGGHVYNTVTLLDGRILLTGGQLVSSIQTMANAPVTATVDIYDPVSNSWTASSMISARAQHAATVLADGRVVVTGGAQGSLGAPTPIAGVELFDPVTNTWTAQPNLLTPRSGHVAHLQPDGLLVLFGGRAAAPLASISTLHF